MIDDIPVASAAPSEDFSDDLPPAVRAVFGEINPHMDDGGTGYADGDMRVRFPNVQPGLKPLPNAGAYVSSDSARTLFRYERERELYGEENEALDPEELIQQINTLRPDGRSCRCTGSRVRR
jgi:hypothetical protein